MLLVTAMTAALLAPAEARADSFWELDTAAADTLERTLQRGDLLAHMCPGCGGEVVVFTLRGLSRAPGTDGDGHRLHMRWRGLATGIVGDSPAMPPLACAPPEALCLPDPDQQCADRTGVLDLPYTFVLRDQRWVWVGELAGLQAPGPNWQQPIAAGRNDRKLPKKCKAMRQPVPPHGRMPPSPGARRGR